MEAINWVIANWPSILAAILAVVGAASAIAKLTPTKTDDRIVDAILGILNRLALNPKAHKARE